MADRRSGLPERLAALLAILVLGCTTSAPPITPTATAHLTEAPAPEATATVRPTPAATPAPTAIASARTDGWTFDEPAAQSVTDWPTAAAIAGVVLFAPTSPDRQRLALTVHGVPGDSTRPVEARWPDGLAMVQALRTVMEPPQPSESFPLSGVAEAWEASVHGERTLYARRGQTLAILTGLSMEAMKTVAAEMKPVTVGRPPQPPPAAVHPSRGAERYVNPVIRTDFPDPAVIQASDGWFYAYATEQLTVVRIANIQVARSRDLVHWELLPDALPRPPSWASDTRDVWAPGVIEAGGRVYLYFAVDPDTHDGMCLAVAVADQPSGPFTPTDAPLACHDGFVDIDPMPFDDPASGKRILYWGSNGSPILARELAADRTHFAPGTRTVEVLQRAPAQPYQRLIEGPWVVRHGNAYYLFTSGDDCCSAFPTYAVMVARSTDALGPFEWRSDSNGVWGDSVILHFSDAWDAPGHNAVVTDAAGVDWIVYHAIDPAHPDQPQVAARKRPMLIDRLDWADGWPTVSGDVPSSGPMSAPSTATRR